MSNFKIEIGTHIKDDKRDLIITDREYRTRKSGIYFRNDKWYKYHCNVCDWEEGWIEERSLLSNTGCSCCCGRTLVQGINDIPTTAPELIQYFVGGYDEAKLYTKYGSGNLNNPKGYIIPKCPKCGKLKGEKTLISNIYQRKNINCICDDGLKFPEKAMFSVLTQLGIDFHVQLTKTTFKWCRDYKYDFHFNLNNEDVLLETHGNQHYKENTNFKRSLKEEQENDKAKKNLALNNNIKEENYIVIDCRKSTLEWIKEHIVSNKKILNKFDLSKIDWNKVEEFALSNRVKEACEYWDNGIHSTKEIGNIMKLHSATIGKYLSKGKELLWCDYDSKKETIKSGKINGKLLGKQVEIFKDNISLGVFDSCHDLQRQSEKLFGIKFNLNSITRVCRRERTHHKGYIFRYVL